MRNVVLRILISVLCLGGATVSALALHVHNMDPSQAPPCAVDAHWDCGIVNHSRFSYFPPKGFDEDATSTKLHIPVATLGIAGYAVMFVLAAFGRWWLLLMVAEIGFGGALMLTYLEAYVIEKWCIYCLWSQCIMAAILAATFLAFYLRRRPLSSPGTAAA